MSEPKQVVSVRLSPELRATIDERAREGEGAPTVVGRAVERYFEICRQSLPRFTALQWEILSAALAGADLSHPGALMSIEHRLAEHLRDTLPQRLKMLPDLMAKFEGITIAGRAALVDHVEKLRADGAS